MEVISPELVLVDPELARAERARLVERARVASIIDAEALRLAVERAIRSEADEESQVEREGVSTSARRYGRRALEGLLLLSLLANGLVLAVFVSGNWDQGTSPAAFARPTSPTLALSASVLNDVPSRSAIASGSRAQGRRAGAAVEQPPPLGRAPTKAALERRIFALIIRAPRARLPVDLIDPTTGLAKNNLQVVCRRDRVPRSSLCVARLAGDGVGRLLVRYRAARGGAGVFTWVRGT